MLVAEWMTRDPATVQADTTLGAAAALMVRRKIRRIPVVVGDEQLVGIVTKSDLLGAAPGSLNPFSPEAARDPSLAISLRRIMTSPPVTVAADAPIETAAQLMIERKIGGLPVLLGQRLAGILTESDVFRAFTAALGGGGGAGLRISFDVSAGEDVVAFIVELAGRHRQRVTSIATFARGGRVSAVVRLVGPESPSLVDELWKTGHRVQSVLRVTTGS
jgi:acetoin utilization protein AcuB